MTWLQFNDEQGAAAASVKAYNFAELSDSIDQGQVTSAKQIAGGWWIYVPAGVPASALSPTLVSNIHPEERAATEVKLRIQGMFDNLDLVMKEFMIENSMMGISSVQARAVADSLRTLWYYMQTSPVTAIEEIDRLLSLPDDQRAVGADAFLSTARLNTFKQKIVDIIGGV